MEEQGTGPAFRREAAKSQQSMERRQKAAAATAETHQAQLRASQLVRFGDVEPYEGT